MRQYVQFIMKTLLIIGFVLSLGACLFFLDTEAVLLVIVVALLSGYLERK